MLDSASPTAGSQKLKLPKGSRTVSVAARQGKRPWPRNRSIPAGCFWESSVRDSTEANGRVGHNQYRSHLEWQTFLRRTIARGSRLQTADCTKTPREGPSCWYRVSPDPVHRHLKLLAGSLRKIRAESELFRIADRCLPSDSA